MTTKKQGATKKTAAKKSTAPLTAIDGGKSIPTLRDGKTQASPEAMRKALGVYGVDVKPDASAVQVLALLRKTLEKKLKGMDEKDMVKCDAVCGEVSTNDTDFCPFCGDEGLEGDQPGAAEAAAAAPAPAPAAEPAPAAPASGKGAKGKAAKADAIVTTSTSEGLAAATAKLDASVARINSLRGDIAGNSYDLGVELRAIHNDELWKARGHADFKEFIEKELEIGRSMAYRLIDIAKEFDRETFMKVGSRKLALVSGIQDAEARDAALEAAKAGASTRDIERHRDQAKGKTTAPPKEPKSGTTPPKKANPNEITLLTKVGSKPQLVGFRSAQSGRPIAVHKDDAYAELQIADDVKLRAAPKLNKDGEIVGITIAFVRVE